MELSVFCDEAGQQNMSAGYYLITLVFHDQSKSIDQLMHSYEIHIRDAELPDIPFHMVDLLQGHGDYEGFDLSIRKQLLVKFNIFIQKIPIQYHTFVYQQFDTPDAITLSAKIKKDLVNFIYDHYHEFRLYERVPVYYDDGQQAVTRGLHEAFDYMLPHGTVAYKELRYQDRRLAQVADYLCSIELAAMRYSQGFESQTYRKFFGLKGDFKRNYLKQARRKLID